MNTPKPRRVKRRRTANAVHSCCLYDTPEERERVLEAVLNEAGPHGGVIFVRASGRSQKNDAAPVEPGSRAILDASPQQYRSLEINLFSQHHVVLSELRREIESVRAEGPNTPEIIVEMCCPAGRKPGAGKLIEFESKLDALLAETGARCTCFYDRASCDPTFLLGVLSTHPHAVIGGSWCDNLYYTPPPKASHSGRPTTVLDQRLSNLLQRTTLEEALRDSEARFRKLVEPNVMGIMSIHRTIITDANDAFLNTVGYTRADLEARRLRWQRLAPQEFRHLDKVAYRELRESGSWTPFEKELIRKNGARVPVLIGGSLLEGYTDRVVCFVFDITERKRAERSQQFLAETGTLLASTLDYELTLQTLVHSAVPFLADWCVIDMLQDDSLERVAVSAADPAHEKILQELAETRYRRNRRHPLIKVLHTGRPAIYAELPDSVLQNITRSASRLEKLRGLEIRSAILVPLTARGHVLGVVTMATAESGRQYGPSDLALAEELARRAALAVDNATLYREAQLAIKARDEFFSAASHELKTPITSLRGYAQFVVRHIDRQASIDRKLVKRTLEVVDQQSDRLARLVNNLLDVSRIEAGKLCLDPSPTDVSSLVKTVVLSVRQRTSGHALRMKAFRPVLAKVDPFRMEQVVTNLLDNAVKYSPEGGRVDISVSTPQKDTVRIAVSDRGIGITPEHRQHIFERFYQAHNNGHYGGIGLGLFIAHQIVTLHGGRIEMESPPEGGTRFVVSLPTDFQLRHEP